MIIPNDDIDSYISMHISYVAHRFRLPKNTKVSDKYDKYFIKFPQTFLTRVDLYMCAECVNGSEMHYGFGYFG
jgi:hypothetical protein